MALPDELSAENIAILVSKSREPGLPGLNLSLPLSLSLSLSLSLFTSSSSVTPFLSRFPSAGFPRPVPRTTVFPASLFRLSLEEGRQRLERDQGGGGGGI